MADDRRPVAVLLDSPALASTQLEGVLRSEGLEVRRVTGEEEIRTLWREEHVELMVLDLALEGFDALGFLSVVRGSELEDYRPVLLVAREEDHVARLAALELGADAVVSRGDAAGLMANLKRCLAIRRTFLTLTRERKQAHQHAGTDALTQLRTRSYFLERLENELRRAQRYDEPLALLIWDLDDFEALNRAHGQAAGDEALKQLGPALKGIVRDTDQCARLHGAAFALLLPKTPLAGALTVAERLWRQIGASRFGPARTVALTASFGVSGYPQRSVLTSDSLLRTTQEALLRAKHEGKNRICLFQE